MKWTKNRIKQEVVKFKTRSEWKKKSRYSYYAARYYNLLRDKSLTGHFLKTEIKVKWTKEKIIKEAKKYKTRKEWRLNNPASYSRAKDKKFKLTADKELLKHFKPTERKVKWTKKKVLEFAKEFDRVKDWKKKNNFSYQLALRNGYLSEATKHMPPLGNRVKRCIYSIKIKNRRAIYIGLTFDFKRRIRDHLKTKRFLQYDRRALVIKRVSEYIEIEDAKKLEIELIEKYKKLRFKVLNQVRGGGVGSGYLVWTKEKLLTSAKRYNNSTDWSNNEMGAYLAALKDKEFFKFATSHFKRKTIKWDKESVLKSAKKFSTRSEWFNKEPGAYNISRSKGWFEEATKHMKILRRIHKD